MNAKRRIYIQPAVEVFQKNRLIGSPHSSLLAIALGLMVLGVSANPLRAAMVLFDNLTAPNPNGATYITNTQISAQKFLTTTESRLSTVSLRLWNQNNTFGSYQIQIWDATGVAGSPGAQVVSDLFTGFAEDLSNDSDNILTVSDLDVILDADTAYFIVLRGNSLTDIESHFPDDPPLPGALAWNMTDTNPSGAYDGGPPVWSGPYTQNYYMKIEANVVPEPTSALLLLLSGSTFCFQRRRAARA